MIKHVESVGKLYRDVKPMTNKTPLLYITDVTTSN